MMHYRRTKIQILDLPGIIEGARNSGGSGRQVITAVYNCNLILIVLDALKSLLYKNIIEEELYDFGIRLNQRPPDIIRK